ncbi:MAG: amidase [Pseudomonadota bacterium]
MNPSDYQAQDATGLAALIAGREVSAAEALDAAVARMEAVNPILNAVILDLTDRARAELAAGTPTGPFGGVPWLIKDIGAQVAGTPTTAGSRLLKDAVAAADSAIVTAYRKAGLVIFGKTNTPEFGLEPVTEPEFFGPTLNPWDLARTPGGSSGGAAAAVAAGIVPAAHASDGGGSIRTPASCCGLFGMKPSRGRVSAAPLGEGWGGASVQHAVTRSVRDSAGLLDAVCRPEPGDPYFLAPPARPFADEVGRDPGRLRVGFVPGALDGGAIDPECAAAVAEAARICEGLGHAAEETAIPFDAEAVRAAAGDVIAASVAAALAAEVARRGRPVEAGEVDAITRAMEARGGRVSGARYVQAMAVMHDAGRRLAALHERFDVLLSSTLGSPPIPKGFLRGEPLDLAGYGPRLFAFMPNTQLFNVTGQPSMTVPLAWSAAGLPIGIQFTAALGEEATLFRLAGQLEKARPWFDRRPLL